MDNNNPLPLAETEKKQDSFDLKTFFRKVFRLWWIFLVSLALCGAIAFILLKVFSPEYNVNGAILIEDSSKSTSSSSSTSSAITDLTNLSGLLGIQSNVDNELQVLDTWDLVGKTVKALKLNVTYYINGTLRNSELYTSPYLVDQIKIRDSVLSTKIHVSLNKNNNPKIEYTDVMGNDVKKVLTWDQPVLLDSIGVLKLRKNPALTHMPKGEYTFILESISQRIAELKPQFKIFIPDDNASAISLVFVYPIPNKGEDILNKFLSLYKEQDVRVKNEIADSTINFINNRLVIIEHDLGGVEKQVQDFKQSNQLADIVEQSKLLLANSSDYNAQIDKIQTQISINDAVANYLKDDSKSKRVVPSSVLPDDPIFAGIVESYNNILIQRDKQLLVSTEDNPYVKSLDDQLLKLRADMLANLANSKKSLDITKKNLDNQANKFKTQVYNVPQQERTYLDLSRQQQIQQALYTYLLQKREETEISKTSNVSSSRVIDPPKAEVLPFSPSKTIFYGLAVFLGLVFPFLRVYILDLLSTKIQSKDDILRVTNVPVIGEISHNISNHNLVVLEGARSAISEQFRALRTNLQFFINDESKLGNVILLTSSMSGEGKSFTTVNLGMSLAITGKKVVLIELDLRKPNLSAKLGLPNTYGFTNYIISSEIDYKNVIMPSTFNENLSIITSGPIPPNPTETILNKRMGVLMDQLKNDFDYIIIDAPPIGLVTDAQLLSDYSDLTLYLVRYKYTKKNQLMIPEDLYKKDRIKKLAIVVNDIASSRGYGYGYGYEYGYGSYGETEDTKKGFFKRLFSKKAE